MIIKRSEQLKHKCSQKRKKTIDERIENKKKCFLNKRIGLIHFIRISLIQ